MVAALKQTLAMPDVKEALDKQGFTPMDMSPDEFGKFYIAEASKWASWSTRLDWPAREHPAMERLAGNATREIALLCLRSLAKH